MKSNFKVIGFDADDTFWVNEPYYRETEDAFCDLLSYFESPEKVSRELFKTEMQNLELYGFGAKAFMLSLIETALRVSDHKVNPAIIQEIIGGYAIHIPFHITWEHEEVTDIEIDHEHFQTVKNISLVPELLTNGINHTP